MQDLITRMQQHLANTYALYLKIQNLHWNITGNKFFIIHELTEKYYEHFASDIDNIAERIRMLGAKVPATLRLFASNTAIKEIDIMANEDHLSLIYDDLQTLTTDVTSIIAQASDLEDETSTSLYSDILTRLEKDLWMLRSYLGK